MTQLLFWIVMVSYRWPDGARWCHHGINTPVLLWSNVDSLGSCAACPQALGSPATHLALKITHKFQVSLMAAALRLTGVDIDVGFGWHVVIDLINLQK